LFRWIRTLAIFALFVALLVYLSLSVGEPAPSYRYTLVVDPGHGGADPGAVGVAGVCEKEITLSIAQLIYLKSLSYPELRVVLTRSEDLPLTLPDRIGQANRIGADLYVSIHANAYYAPSVSGVETFIDEDQGYTTGSHRLAVLLQRYLVSHTGARDRGVKRASLYLHRAKMPAALVEVGFLTNPVEEKCLQSLSYQGEIADAILDAVVTFLDNS
jgi:N-acetylmuramoyl-L-alanine amidase